MFSANVAVMSWSRDPKQSEIDALARAVKSHPNIDLLIPARITDVRLGVDSAVVACTSGRGRLAALQNFRHRPGKRTILGRRAEPGHCG